MAKVRVNGSEKTHTGMVTNSDEDGVDIDVIVNFNPTANIVGSSVTGGNTSSRAGSEAEIELGDIEVESESESGAGSESKSKATAEGGGGFVPPGQQNGPPGQGSDAKSEGVLTKAKNLLPGGKKAKEKKEKKSED